MDCPFRIHVFGVEIRSLKSVEQGFRGCFVVEPHRSSILTDNPYIKFGFRETEGNHVSCFESGCFGFHIQRAPLHVYFGDIVERPATELGP